MLPEPIVRRRVGDLAPIIRPWGAVVATGGRYHWCNPFETINDGFVCPHLDKNRSSPGGQVMLAQDVLEWDPGAGRWVEGALRACGYCLPHGLIVTPEPPAWRRLVVTDLRHAEQLTSAAAA